MMKKLLLSILFCLSGLVQRSAALDLTPNEVIPVGDGPVIKRYFFNDADKRLTFRMDPKMSVSGERDSVTFRFADLEGAAMKMSRALTQPKVAFDERNLEVYRHIAQSSLPADAKEVQLEQESSDAIAINGWTSHQFVFSYKLFGFAQRRSITFLNFNSQEQFVIDVAATADDYSAAYARGYRVLNSITDTPVSSTGPT